MSVVDRTLSTFVRSMGDAMTQYLTMRREGVARDDAVKGLEAVLRDSWPTATTKFPPHCDHCEDTGVEDRVCEPYFRCGRRVCQERGEEWEHRYVVPCSCAQGQRYYPKMAQAGKDA